MQILTLQSRMEMTEPSRQYSCVRHGRQAAMRYEVQVDTAERRLKPFLWKRYANGYAARLKNWIG
ncbi:hypothetical protein [Paenibacillus agricola]|uniref:Uncharacterized protein n=1 Tax=Paenibacillus agricola TaxID=2716264 RepID=A0ABX0JJA7_9BACL|nr:hypothetical protein [Paenibacillus agricola]NHN35431.1 hypothetical protein [Paenibacillus agricola]